MSYMDTIYLEQLAILGWTKEQQWLVVFTICLCVLFFCLQPFILFLHYRHYTIVLTYVISSMVMMIILLFAAYIGQDSLLMKAGLKGMAIFGLCCIVYAVYRSIKYAHK